MAILPTIIGFVSSKIISSKYDDYNYDYDYDDTYSEAEDDYTDHSDLYVAQDAEDGTYSVQYQGYTLTERKVSDLTDEERNSLTGGIISGDTVWEIDLDLDINISDSNRQVKFTFAYNTAYDENDNSFFSNNFFPGEKLNAPVSLLPGNTPEWSEEDLHVRLWRTSWLQLPHHLRTD